MFDALVIREVHIKTMRWHFLPIRLEKNKNNIKDWEYPMLMRIYAKETHILLARVLTDTTFLGKWALPIVILNANPQRFHNSII